MNFSLTSQIEEVDRELEQRKAVYPSLVASRSMRQSIAEFQITRGRAHDPDLAARQRGRDPRDHGRAAHGHLLAQCSTRNSHDIS